MVGKREDKSIHAGLEQVEAGRVGEHVELPRLKSIAPKRKRRILLQRCVAREHTRGVGKTALAEAEARR
jgi:hypothetical protein